MTCMSCRTGTTVSGSRTATFDDRTTMLVIRRVPAEVCAECGEAFFDSVTTERLLELARAARKSGNKLTVRLYAAA